MEDGKVDDKVCELGGARPWRAHSIILVIWFQLLTVLGKRRVNLGFALKISTQMWLREIPHEAVGKWRWALKKNRGSK